MASSPVKYLYIFVYVSGYKCGERHEYLVQTFTYMQRNNSTALFLFDIWRSFCETCGISVFINEVCQIKQTNHKEHTCKNM
jgi:hypothetical protein